MVAATRPVIQVDFPTRPGGRPEPPPKPTPKSTRLSRVRGSRWVSGADSAELPVAVGFGVTRRPILWLTGPAADPALRPDADPEPDIDVGLDVDAVEPGRLRHRALRLVPALTAGHRRELVHLTPRGHLVLLAIAGAIGLALIGGAWSGAGGRSAPPRSVPARVVVHDADTLWGIAVLLSPDRDPRDEVSDLRRLNHLSDTVLTPGQVLRTR